MLFLENYAIIFENSKLFIHTDKHIRVEVTQYVGKSTSPVVHCL